VSHKLAEAMYKAGPGPSDGAAEGGSTETHDAPKQDEGVIDAEYVDVDKT
jgi:molecular chaperone DnaK